MTEQQENELICEKLLGWKLAGRSSFGAKMWLNNPYGDDGAQWQTVPTPSFDTWADAGLMASALRARGIAFDIHSTGDGGWLVRPAQKDSDRLGYLRLGDHMAKELPDAIRAAALEYIRRQS